MSQPNFSVRYVQKKSVEVLAKFIAKHRAPNPGVLALKLKAYAQSVIAPPDEVIREESRRLKSKVNLLKAVREVIVDEEQCMARILVQTPGFFLTSIPGVGIVLASHYMAELRPNTALFNESNIASYAGIIPREHQTGGEDHLPKKGSLPRACNHTLKNYLLQIAHQVGTTGHPAGKVNPDFREHALMRHYRMVDEREGKSLLSTARCFIRCATSMVNTRSIYLPEEFIHPDMENPVSKNEFSTYLTEATKAINRKWKAFDLTAIPEEQNQLLEWRKNEKTLQALNKDNMGIIAR